MNFTFNAKDIAKSVLPSVILYYQYIESICFNHEKLYNNIRAL